MPRDVLFGGLNVEAQLPAAAPKSPVPMLLKQKKNTTTRCASRRPAMPVAERATTGVVLWIVVAFCGDVLHGRKI